MDKGVADFEENLLAVYGRVRSVEDRVRILERNFTRLADSLDSQLLAQQGVAEEARPEKSEIQEGDLVHVNSNCARTGQVGKVLKVKEIPGGKVAHVAFSDNLSPYIIFVDSELAVILTSQQLINLGLLPF